jgi:hypothetical protein
MAQNATTRKYRKYIPGQAPMMVRTLTVETLRAIAEGREPNNATTHSETVLLGRGMIELRDGDYVATKAGRALLVAFDAWTNPESKYHKGDD